jgi:hypothetical protein
MGSVIVDCHQLKQMGVRSAGRAAAFNNFTPTACVRSMTTWEESGMFKLEVGGETATGCVARIWEEDGSVLSSA